MSDQDGANYIGKETKEPRCEKCGGDFFKGNESVTCSWKPGFYHRLCVLGMSERGCCNSCICVMGTSHHSGVCDCEGCSNSQCKCHTQKTVGEVKESCPDCKVGFMKMWLCPAHASKTVGKNFYTESAANFATRTAKIEDALKGISKALYGDEYKLSVEEYGILFDALAESYKRGREDTEKRINLVIDEKSKAEGAAEERQFILNVLDGIDLADAQTGLPPNTKAIRFALQSRFIQTKDTPQ